MEDDVPLGIWVAFRFHMKIFSFFSRGQCVNWREVHSQFLWDVLLVLSKWSVILYISRL